ncbi:MAG: flavodoxin family protein [Lawsonibacter sp.]|jgi:multimeric flavodoxin WrbA
MNVCILLGSPRKNGNTAALVTPFREELVRRGCQCETIWLYEKQIAPCTACRTCQNDWSGFGCRIQDDAYPLFDRVLACDLLVLATPIYSWYCTPPMKALLDRLVYGMNKYYGAEKGPSLWKGKKLALISTCGYPPEKGADLWENGIIRYCKHSQLQYQGLLVERHLGYDVPFMDPDKQAHARAFAAQVCRSAPSLSRPSLTSK